MTEEEIVAGLHASEEKSLVALRERLGLQLLIHAMRLLRDRLLAEEVLNDVFVSLWASDRKRLITFVNVRKYLYGAINQAASKLRAKNETTAQHLASYREHMSRTEEELDREMLAAEIRAEKAAAVEKAIAQLPFRTRQILELYLIYGLTPAEIARQLNISINTVKNLKVIGVKSVQERMQVSNLPGASTRKVKNRRKK